MNDTIVVAVPIESGEGLEAQRSAHFGHAAGFALVSMTDGRMDAVTTLSNPPHSHGGCMSTVNLLASNGVTDVAAAGMGRRPLAGLQSAGIRVHHDPVSETVVDAALAVVAGTTGTFGPEHACSGH